MPDWSQLPEELLHLISKNLENGFDVVHARSVCRIWRSTFPFPSCLLRPSYSLPAAFTDCPLESPRCKDLCTFEKVPLFLFRVQTPPPLPAPGAAAIPSYYYLGGISRDKSEDHLELLPSPLQCSVKVKIRRSDDPVVLNILDCQIIPLGYQYRRILWNPQTFNYRGMAFLPLNKEGGGEEYSVIVNYTTYLLVLRSTEMKWMKIKNISVASCDYLMAFRGRFYAAFRNENIFVIDPYSLEATPLIPSHPWSTQHYLVPYGNDELFLVEKIFPRGSLSCFRSACRVSRLDEEAGKWVEVSDVGDLILFIRHSGNVSCYAKDFPEGCGLSGNSILCSNAPDLYKYGPLAEGNTNCWRFSRENYVSFLSIFPVVALWVESCNVLKFLRG